MPIDLQSHFAEHIVTGLKNLLTNLPVALFDLILGIVVIRVLERIVRFLLTLTSIQPTLRDVIASVLEIFLWLFLAMSVLTDLGFSGIVSFFTGSVVALGILMAAGGSTLVSDIVAGIFLARDNDFNVGDEIIVGETPTQGVIESMDARRIRLRDEKGILHVIPNSVAERKEWVVVRRRPGINTLVKAAKAAKRLKEAAKEKRRKRAS